MTSLRHRQLGQTLSSLSGLENVFICSILVHYTAALLDVLEVLLWSEAAEKALQSFLFADDVEESLRLSIAYTSSCRVILIVSGCLELLTSLSVP